MAPYRLLFHADRGSDPSVREVESADDGAAVQTALSVLRDTPAVTAVEVFADTRLITRMERPDEAFLNARSGLHGLR